LILFFSLIFWFLGRALD